MKSPQQIAANWQAKMAGSASNATAGAQSVSEAPGIKAAAQKGAYMQGVSASVDRWAANVAAVPLEAWRQAFIQKGVPRMAEGARVAAPKVAQFMNQLLPHIQSGLASLPPRGPKGSNIGRMQAWHDHMLKFKHQA